MAVCFKLKLYSVSRCKNKQTAVLVIRIEEELSERRIPDILSLLEKSPKIGVRTFFFSVLPSLF